jgi:3-oxoacyl-[acyl-carrier-protein] synthase III
MYWCGDMLVTTSVANNYERPDEWIHGEKKSGKQFMLTESASTAIDEIAKRLGISRSEVVERAARCGGMVAAERYDAASGICKN